MAKSIAEIYRVWLDGQSSEETAKVYRNYVNKFCSYVFDKTPEQLSEDDISSDNFYPGLVQDKFINRLRDEDVQDSSIRNYMNAVSSFMDALESNRVSSEADFLYIKKNVLNKKSLKKDGGHVSMISRNDLAAFEDFLRNRKYRSKAENVGLKYAGVVDFMFTFATRVSATFNIKWSDIKDITDIKGNTDKCAYVHDKGKGSGSRANQKVIAPDYYAKMRELYFTGDESDTIFHELTQDTFTRMMKEFSEKTGRDMTPHSIKVGAVSWLYELTHDIVLCQQFADHEDIETTQRYIRLSGANRSKGTYIMSEGVNVSDINDISPEEIAAIVKSDPVLAFNVLREYREASHKDQIA